ncbi:MAG: Hsp70 family protein [Ignavibacteriae bacterium]|nr:Hsp70 family protein [Ignavibacteriota bacterium]
MARTKIDYGIDLGTTNSAISRMENGEATIKKLPQKDTMASCVAFNKKGILVGDKAYAAYRSEKESALSKDISQNAFIEFKRTMGTDKKYSSEYGGDLSSEELSAEILKSLKSFITDENFSSIVITVPAAFKNNQKEATREAAKLAGFSHIELLQEPVAAAMAYGLDTDKKDGFWLVFDFGGGTFDAALLKVEEGIMKVIDTEGDNYLGGKNLDYAIVDEILIPHIQENFSIDSYLNDEAKKSSYRDALKSFAEELKNELSFKDSYNLYKEDRCGVDDEDEEIEIDVTISQSEIEKVLKPVFQKAVNCSLTLLERNNLKGSSLDSLILVGGPTFSPVLRKMLEEQICKPDTSVDPMTVVSKGAALYASTVDVSEEVREQTRDKTKIQLEIANESSTVETEEYVPIKILADKTEGEIPNQVFAEVTRGDKAWSSGKVEINTIGEVVEIQLNEGKTNVFEVVLFDDKGNILESEPSSFSVIQGSKIGSATLAYNFGIDLKDKSTGKIRFKTVKGLEKNQSIPAVGALNDLKTQKQIRPGMDSDEIKIPLYEGEYGSDGTRAIYNEHVSTVKITGADLPSLLPENSSVDITVNIDRSEKITLKAYFPYLDFTYESDAITFKESVDTEWLANEIRMAKGSIQELMQEESVDENKLKQVENEITEIEKTFENNKNEIDSKKEVLTNLRKTLKIIDDLSIRNEWPKLEETLKEEFYRLEKANNDLGNEKTTQVVNQFRSQLDEVIRAKDVKLGNVLLEEIGMFFFKLTEIYQFIGMIRNFNENFGDYSWSNPTKARQLVNSGMEKIANGPDKEELREILIPLYDMIPTEERPSGDDSVLVG